MDILIKNMTAPKYCFEDDGSMIAVCPFLDICRRKWGVNINASNIHSKCCPLIPVPEHGDLIDRDAVLNELKKYYKVGEVAEVGEVACFISDAEVVLEKNT